MNILQLLNEKTVNNNGEENINKEAIKKEALRIFQRNWGNAVFQVERIFKKNIERRKKPRVAILKKKVVNETVLEIGKNSVNVNYKYEDARKFITSVMVVGILLHLSIKYKNYTERWWDEFDKIKALPTEQKFDVVKRRLKKDLQNVDKETAIKVLEQKYGSIKKAQMLFASFFGEVGFTKRSKEAIEDVKSYTQAHGIVSKSVEEFIKQVFSSFEKQIKEQPLRMNRFPDFKVVEKVPRGIFAGALPGDYIEAKTKTLKSSDLNAKIFKQSMGIKGDVIDAAILNENRRKTLELLGAGAPRGKRLYYFMREGTSSNFSFYKVKDIFYRGVFTGDYNLTTKKGQIIYTVSDIKFNLITKGGKVLLVDAGSSRNFKNNFLASMGEPIDMIGMRKQMGKMREFKGAVQRKKETAIRQFRKSED